MAARDRPKIPGWLVKSAAMAWGKKALLKLETFANVTTKCFNSHQGESEKVIFLFYAKTVP